jgi:hypothetical protein
MSNAQVKAAKPLSTGGRIVRRVAAFLLLAAAIGWMLNRTSVSFAHDPNPAGFPRGLLQGALMPMAFPNLLLGRDVTIYAPNNTGRGYKLGYTAGVNLCGAAFFGFCFWRLQRWRRKE